MSNEEKLYKRIELIKHASNKEYVLQLTKILLKKWSPKTILLKVQYAKDLSNFLDKKYVDMSKEDIESFIEFKEKHLTGSTLTTCKQQIKNFITLVHNPGNELHQHSRIAPDIIKDIISIKPKDKRGNKLCNIKPGDLYSWHEILLVAKSTTNIRDRAVATVLFDSGARSGEFCNVKRKDLKFDNSGVEIHLDGKTGPRDIFVSRCLSIFLEHYNNAPEDKRKPDDYIWLSKKGNPLNGNEINNILRSMVSSAQIMEDKQSAQLKYIYSHLLRHSRATEASKLGWSNKLMEDFFGWEIGSPMPSYYSSLSTDDMREIILKNAGEFKKIDKSILGTKDKICPNCQTLNSGFNTNCYKCNRVLDDKVFSELKELREQNQTLEQEIKDSKLTIKELTEKIEEVRELITTSVSFVDAIGDDEITRLKKLNREQSE